MSRKRLNPDQLWHFLCPALSAPKRHIITVPATRRPRCHSPVPSLSTCLQKHYGSIPTQRSDDQNQRIQGDAHLDGETGDGAYRKTPDKFWSIVEPQKHLQPKRRRVPGSLELHSTKELEDILAKGPLKIINAMQILHVLIRDRQIQPEARHYKSLIQCNSDPLHGSPIMVRKLLLEMGERGVPIDSGTLHAALQAVAVHPDYPLRQDVLRQLRDRWLPVSPDGWHYVVAGLIREHQFELALDHIAHMERKDIMVKDWLHSLLIYHLCEVHEFDQVLELMASRVSQGHGMTRELWTIVLEAATNARHYDLTCFIWKRIVELGNTPPGTRLCNGVLNVAEHVGDKELAASVSNMLRHNDFTSGTNDYETLSNARLKSDGLYAALEVLCAMQQVGGRVVHPKSTQVIRDYCIQRKVHARDVWKMLKELESAGRKIPLGCAGVVIDLCTEAAADDPFAVDDGISFYEDIHILCGRTPDQRTFNALIGMCRIGNNVEAAMFFVKDMAALGVLPDATTFEHLMVMCVEAENFKSAYLYFEDFLQRGFALSKKARIMIRDLCTVSDDSFAEKLRVHPGLQEQEKDLKDNKAAQREYNKKRRKRKRRALAIARSEEEEGWKDYEPSLSTPEDLLDKVDKRPTGGAEARKG